MKIVTDSIDMDEPCYGVYELNRMTLFEVDGSTALRRVRVTYVIRDDAIAEYCEDLGPPTSADEEVNGYFSLGDDTVGELRYAIQNDKVADDIYRRLREEVRGSSTLIDDAIRQAEQATQGNRSVFGPGISKQRGH